MNKSIFAMMPVIAILFGAIPSAMAQQSGYNITVNVTHHAFGVKVVKISVNGENGFSQYQWVNTAGGASWTFSVPADQGNSIQACVQNGGDIVGILLAANCYKFDVTGSDMTVNIGA